MCSVSSHAQVCVLFILFLLVTNDSSMFIRVCLDVEGVGFCSTDGIDSSLFVAVDGMALLSVACVDGNRFLRL